MWESYVHPTCQHVEAWNSGIFPHTGGTFIWSFLCRSENIPLPSRTRARHLAASKLFLFSTATARLTQASLRLPLSHNIPEGRAGGTFLKASLANEDRPGQPLGVLLWVKWSHAAGELKDLMPDPCRQLCRQPQRKATLVSSLDYYLFVWCSLREDTRRIFRRVSLTPPDNPRVQVSKAPAAEP